MTTFDAPAAGVPRFGALTYTSYSAPSYPGAPGRSGWQIKEQTTDIDDSERSLLTGWVPRTLDPVDPIPQYPTAADIRALPRCLTYVRLDATRAVYSHTAPAGSDNQGRPGNVFAHLLLDRAVQVTAPHRRPIDLWRSPDWLTPFGQTEVSSAPLDPTTPCPRPSESIGHRAVLEFLLGSETWRIKMLCLLLDAVAPCLRGGPRIVLGVDDPDTAALWIAAITSFTSPACAARLSWSTFVRAGDVDAAFARGLLVVATPTRDIAALTDNERRFVVDTTQPVRHGEYRESRHRTARGVEVEVTEWSVLAETALIDIATAAGVLSHLDVIAERIPDAAQLEPAWPLAMVVAADSRLRDAEQEARQVIARETRVRLSDHPELHRSVLAVMLPGLGHTAEDAWRVLNDPKAAASHDPSTRDLVWKMFVIRALHDPAWLAAEARTYDTRLPTLAASDHAEVAAEVDKAVRGLATRVRAHRENLTAAVDIARAALRTLELLGHLGPAGRGADDKMIAVLEDTLRPILLDRRRGAEFIANYGPIDSRVRTGFVQRAVEPDRDLERPLGQRFSAEVADWVLGSTFPEFAALRRDPGLIESTRYHIGADRIFRHLTAPDAESRRRWAPYAPIALARALHEAHAPQRWCATDIAPVFAEQSNITDLIQIDRDFGGLVPLHLYHRALASAVSDAELDTLAHHVIGRRASGSRGKVTLNATATDPGRDALTASWADLVTVNWPTARRSDIARWRTVLTDHHARPDSQPPAALNFNLGIAYLMARSSESDTRATTPVSLRPGHAVAVLSAVTEDWNTTVAVLRRLVDHDCLDAFWICGLAVVTASEQLASATLGAQDPLRRLRSTSGTTLFEEVAQYLLGSPHLFGAPATVDRLVEAVQQQLRANGNDHRFETGPLREFIADWRDRIMQRGVRA